MQDNDGHCLNMVSFSARNLECSCTDSPGRGASPSHVVAQHCWYLWHAATETYKVKLRNLSEMQQTLDFIPTKKKPKQGETTVEQQMQSDSENKT